MCIRSNLCQFPSHVRKVGSLLKFFIKKKAQHGIIFFSYQPYTLRATMVDAASPRHAAPPIICHATSLNRELAPVENGSNLQDISMC